MSITNYLRSLSVSVVSVLASGCVGTAQTVTRQVEVAPGARTYAQAPVALSRPPRTLATVYRYGAQWDEYFVRGDASVAPSPDGERVGRLAAWDGDNAQELSRVAIAAAIYMIPLPPETAIVRIEVGYQRLEVSQNQKVAGFVFVRNRAVEQQYSAADTGDRGSVDEPGFYGDTYVLAADQSRVVLELPTADLLNDGVLELHLSAGAGQALDVQFLEVKALVPVAQPAQAQVVYVPAPAPVVQATVIEYVGNPDVYSYNYYYIGPWHSRHHETWVSYSLFDVDIHPFYIGGWVTYRAWFWDQHPWVCRPVHYTHVRMDSDWDHRRREGGVVIVSGAGNHHVDAYRSEWYARNFHVDRDHQDQRGINDNVRNRRVTVSREGHDEFVAANHAIHAQTQQTQQALHQQSGDRYREKVQGWNRNPGQAHRDLEPVVQRNPGYQEALTKLKGVPPTRSGAGSFGAPTQQAATVTPGTVVPPPLPQAPRGPKSGHTSNDHDGVTVVSGTQTPGTIGAPSQTGPDGKPIVSKKDPGTGGNDVSRGHGDVRQPPPGDAAAGTPGKPAVTPPSSGKSAVLPPSSGKFGGFPPAGKSTVSPPPSRYQPVSPIPAKPVVAAPVPVTPVPEVSPPSAVTPPVTPPVTPIPVGRSPGVPSRSVKGPSRPENVMPTEPPVPVTPVPEVSPPSAVTPPTTPIPVGRSPGVPSRSVKGPSRSESVMPSEPPVRTFNRDRQSPHLVAPTDIPAQPPQSETIKTPKTSAPQAVNPPVSTVHVVPTSPAVTTPQTTQDGSTVTPQGDGTDRRGDTRDRRHGQ